MKTEIERQSIENYLKENYEYDIDKILLADGFENAFMGITESFGQKPRACYDSSKCLDISSTVSLLPLSS